MRRVGGEGLSSLRRTEMCVWGDEERRIPPSSPLHRELPLVSLVLPPFCWTQAFFYALQGEENPRSNLKSQTFAAESFRTFLAVNENEKVGDFLPTYYY